MPLKNKVVILLFLLAAIIIVPKKIFSSKCSGLPVDQFTICLDNLGKTKNSLKSEIDYIDSQIELTTYKINETQGKIVSTQNEVEILNSKIDNLDQSLDYLSKLLIQKIVQGYKQKSISLFDVFFDSKNANDLLMKIKYVKTSRDNNQKLLVQVQQAKLNAEEQKLLREEKKTELNKLEITFDNQKIQLNKQQEAKRVALSWTEAEYNNAKQELLAMTTFARSAGGGLTSFGTGSNGWYYTQRDPQWGNLTLGSSPYQVWEAGCAITSVAMVCKSYGQNITPTTMATDYSKFIYGDLRNDQFGCDGKTSTWISQSEIENYVKQNIPVILRLSAPSISGLHFVVAWKWDGNDFVIHDPYYGPDKKFSERYTWSQITTAIAIH